MKFEARKMKFEARNSKFERNSKLEAPIGHGRIRALGSNVQLLELRSSNFIRPSNFDLRTFLPALLFLFGLLCASVRAADDAIQLDPAVAQAEQARIAAAAKAIPSVLAIFSPGGQGGGSGVVISPDGYALTNFHVARPCGTFMKCGMADGKLYDAVIVGLDPVGDVGMIKLFGRDDFPAAEMADSDDVQVGDWCFAMGNPFLLATDFHPTVSYGVVSGVHRYQYPAGTLLEYTDCLQVDAAINPGNSGGPLFDSKGRLIGINGRGSFEKRGRVNVGVGYSISINQIKNFLGNLKSGRIVDHATFGARVSTSDDNRVLVSDILEQSDAYRRGLRYDDEILSFAGRPVSSVNALKNVEGIFPKGWRVSVSYRRDGKTYDTYVRLMGVHTEAELLAKIEGQQEIEPPRPRPQPRGDVLASSRVPANSRSRASNRNRATNPSPAIRRSCRSPMPICKKPRKRRCPRRSKRSSRNAAVTPITISIAKTSSAYGKHFWHAAIFQSSREVGLSMGSFARISRGIAPMVRRSLNWPTMNAPSKSRPAIRKSPFPMRPIWNSIHRKAADCWPRCTCGGKCCWADRANSAA